VLSYFCQTQNVTREKLREALSYEQRARKMLLKLSPRGNQFSFHVCVLYYVCVMHSCMCECVCVCVFVCACFCVMFVLCVGVPESVSIHIIKVCLKSSIFVEESNCNSI